MIRRLTRVLLSLGSGDRRRLISFTPCHLAKHARRYDMDKVYLRHTTESEDLQINFHYVNAELSIDREFNFCRKLTEKVDDALTRIRSNIEKELCKKAKKNKKKTTPAEVPPSPSVAAADIVVELRHAVDTHNITGVTFAEVLGINDAIALPLHLRIMESSFEVVINQPWVVNLALPASMLAGYMVYPTKLEVQFAERQYCRGAWYKSKMPASGDLQRAATWLHCGDGLFYRTSNEDVEHYLKFVLTPGNAAGELGPSIENIAKSAVQAGPGPCPFEARHLFTLARLSGQSMRVVSYNLLADLYADSDYSRTQLFPYCPGYALAIEYRKQLFIKELLGYNADIVCLQEVDMKIFENDLQPLLETPEAGGMSGLIAQKGTCGEGLATFYRKERYELLQTRALNIGENIKTLPAFAALWQKISGNEKLVERICERSTTLQVSLLRCRENDRHLLVANTHLYFHPDADHIRLLQIGFAMLYLEHLYVYSKTEFNLSRWPAIVFCGDFNSVPECGIYQLMTERFAGPDLIDWRSNAGEAVKDVTLSQPFSIRSACGTPPYTNYTHAFAACLDYIFYQSDQLEVEQIVPLPTVEELRAYVAIPSVVFPSDHVALVADLKFKEH